MNYNTNRLGKVTKVILKCINFKFQFGFFSVLEVFYNYTSVKVYVFLEAK